MYQHVQGKATKVLEKNEKVTEELSDIVSKAMSVKPDHRFQTMAEFMNALDQV